MRLSTTAALCLGWLISLTAGGISAALPIILSRTGPGALHIDLPDAAGSWRMQQRLELPDDERKMLGAASCWRRQYQCQRTQQHVVATLAAGPSGRIAAHSPEVCYASRDYRPTSAARTVQVDGVEGRFWIHSFRPRIVGQPTLTVAYAWHDGHRWCAPRSPRWELAGKPQIWRLQVTCQHPEWAAGDAAAALTDFLQQALADVAEQDRPNAIPAVSLTDDGTLAASSARRPTRDQRSRP